MMRLHWISSKAMCQAMVSRASPERAGLSGSAALGRLPRELMSEGAGSSAATAKGFSMEPWREGCMLVCPLPSSGADDPARCMVGLRWVVSRLASRLFCCSCWASRKAAAAVLVSPLGRANSMEDMRRERASEGLGKRRLETGRKGSGLELSPVPGVATPLGIWFHATSLCSQDNLLGTCHAGGTGGCTQRQQATAVASQGNIRRVCSRLQPHT